METKKIFAKNNHELPKIPITNSLKIDDLKKTKNSYWNYLIKKIAWL